MCKQYAVMHKPRATRELNRAKDLPSRPFGPMNQSRRRLATKVSLLVTLLLASLASAQNSQILSGESPVVVLVSKCLPVNRTFKKEVPDMAPPREMTAGNKNAARIARVNNPQIPDPNETTIDGRSAAIEKIVQEAPSADPKPLDGFSYLAKIRNGGK